MKTNSLILLGGGGHCKSVIDVAESAGYTILGILDKSELVGTKVLDYEIIGTDDDIPRYVDKAEFLITVGQIKSPAIRRKLAQLVEEAGGRFATVIANDAYVSKYATIGAGTVVMHKAFVNADAHIGKHCIINTLANIEHDCQIGNFCHISTGVMVNGDCIVPDDTFIGSQSVINNGVNMCEWVNRLGGGGNPFADENKLNSRKVLFIIGGHSLSLEIRETANLTLSQDYKIINVIADNDTCIYNYITDSQLESECEKYDEITYIHGFTNLTLRKKYDELFEKYNGKMINIIHPHAYISITACIGKGNYIACNAVISSCVEVGDSNVINYGVTLGHDAKIGNHCVINPGARISGNVHIGDRCLIGSDSFIYQGLSICHDTKIDAMTYIRKSIKTSSICSNRPKLIMVDNIQFNK